MPSLADLLHGPRRTPPEPVQVDLARVLLVGSALWGVAFVVVVALTVAGTLTSGRAVAMCAVGAAAGALASASERRRARR